MERDRTAALIIRLAHDGFDFSKADVFDPRWQLKFRCAMDESNRRNWAALYAMRQQNQLALVVRHDIPASGAEAAYDTAQELANDTMDLRFPWLAGSQDKRDWTEELHDGWVDTWGDPNSEETQKQIAATVAWLDANTAKVGKSAYG